jgi:ABC-type transporter Mla MlaB component
MSAAEAVRPIPSFSLEVFGSNAILYLRGLLTTRIAVQAMTACESLPPQVKNLRIDMRRVERADGRGVDHVALRLRPWRELRDGTTRIDLPYVPMTFSVHRCSMIGCSHMA